MILAAFGLAIYAGALALAAASDLARFRIPNQVVLALAAGFVLFAPSLPLASIGLDLSAAVAVLLLGAVLFAFRIMGGGDVKLLAAATLWTGWGLLLPFLLLTSLAGAGLALLLLAARQFVPRSMPPDRWYGRLLARGEGVPYGIAIAIAGLVLLPRIAAPVLR